MEIINLNPPKSSIFISDNSVIADEESCLRKGSSHIVVDVRSNAWISRMVDIKSVIVQTLVHHLIDNIPFLDSAGLETWMCILLDVPGGVR